MSKYFQLFKDNNFVNLFLGSLFANFSQSMATITIIWTVYVKTDNPFIIVVALLCLELPVILFGPLLGNLLDKYKVKTMINYSNLSRGLLFLLLIIFPLDSTVNYLIFFLLIIISSSFVPIAKSGEIILVGKITNQHNRIQVNSLMNILFDLSNIFGALAGGLVLAIGIGSNVFLINGFLFIISSVFFLFINEAAVKKTTSEDNNRSFQKWRIEFTEGLKYVFNNKTILSLILVSFFWNFLIWGTAPTLTPIFTNYKIEAGPNAYGILNAATSIGIILGSLLSGIKQIKMSPLNIVLLSVGLHGLLYGLFGFSNSLLIGCVILAFAGAISAPAMIYNRTLMQNVVPEHMQGRVFTVAATAGTIGFPVGNSIAAIFLELGGKSNVGYLFFVAGMFVFLFCLILLLFWRKRGLVNGHSESRVCEEIKSP